MTSDEADRNSIRRGFGGEGGGSYTEPSPLPLGGGDILILAWIRWISELSPLSGSGL